MSIMIADGNYTTILADTTSSIDVHLRKPAEFCRVLLPGGNCIVIEASGEYTVYDKSDSQLHEGQLVW